MIINTQHEIKAIMSEYVKPVLTVLFLIKIPDWVKVIFDAMTTENISECAVFVTQVGGAIYMMFKLYDWINNKLKDKKDESKGL